MESQTQFSPMQQLKRRIYAMRNGIVADTLRRSGCPHRFIFGLNLPQLNEIAAELQPSVQLAEQLWADSSSRESRLLAPMLYPIDSLDIDTARRLVATAAWSEDADILCFKLLRHATFAPQLADELAQSPERLHRYTALRLYFCLVATLPAQALAAANAEMQRPDAISGLASMLAQEAKFILDPDAD